MEKTINNPKTVISIFTPIIIICSILYSCSTQKGLGQVTTYDTVLVPKQYRPSVNPNLTKNPLRMSPDEQKAFNKKLSYVLDNSEKTFNDVSDIKGYLKDLNDVILARATELRKKNDSLLYLVLQGNHNMISMQKFANEERLARIASEKQNRLDQLRIESKAQQEREQNQAYRDTITVLITVAFTIFVLLVVGVVVLLILVHRQKVYLRTHFSNV